MGSGEIDLVIGEDLPDVGKLEESELFGFRLRRLEKKVRAPLGDYF